MSERAAAVQKGKVPQGPDPLVGRTINERFKVTQLIARGGMGKVYKAEQAPLGRVCALKVLNPSYAGDSDPEFSKRFFLEASTVAKLSHPNTVTIFDYGKTPDDIYYMAMEFLEGQTLYRAIRSTGAFPEDRVIHITRQVCRAVREAHGIGVIHRDLKPANIFLVQHGDEPDFVKVLDFGLVKNVEGKGEDLTRTGLFMGSPKYMAPEQIRGDKVDIRTDIYALGVIMYEMLAGKVPFDRTNSVNILLAHVNEEPPPLRTMNPAVMVSDSLEQIVMRAMAKDPAQRYANMDELLTALKSIGPMPTHTISGVTGGHTTSTMNGTPAPAITGVRLASSAPAASSPPPPARSAPPSVQSSGDVAAVVAPAPSSKATEGGAATSEQWRQRGIMAVGAALVLVLGLIVYLALKPSEKKSDGVTDKPNVTVTTVSVAGEYRVRVTSDPEGAAVREEGTEICPSTPCDVIYRGPESEATREHRMVVTKSGYKPETRVVRITESPISIKLVRENR